MSHLNTHQTHPLIPREQTYVLDRKLISFHSIDRDISKWPEANHFEIMLPETLKNIQSMRLATISIPNDQYVFSVEYQNTKLSFSMKPYGPTTFKEYYTIEINEGSYTPKELVIEIQDKMNKAISDATGVFYNSFKCQYNKVTNTFWFGNIKDFFSLRFDVKQDYGLLCPNQTVVWDQYTNWGLPSYLGYQKTIYESQLTPGGWNLLTGLLDPSGGKFGFDYITEAVSKYWLTSNNTNQFVNVTDPQPPANLTELSGMIGRFGVNWCFPCNDNRSPYPQVPGRASGPPAPTAVDWKKKAKICNINIMGEDVIYMEVDRYNTMDEIAPYSKNTSAERCNDYHAKVNSAFAKIPVPCRAFSQIFDTRNAFLMNIAHYEPPLERLARMKFKFRYHDGRLVDFKCLPLSFTIEFNMLRNEQLRAKNVRIPGLYTL
jgi:hypothetical protein